MRIHLRLRNNLSLGIVSVFATWADSASAVTLTLEGTKGIIAVEGTAHAYIMGKYPYRQTRTPILQEMAQARANDLCQTGGFDQAEQVDIQLTPTGSPIYRPWKIEPRYRTLALGSTGLGWCLGTVYGIIGGVIRAVVTVEWNCFITCYLPFTRACENTSAAAFPQNNTSAMADYLQTHGCNLGSCMKDIADCQPAYPAPGDSSGFFCTNSAPMVLATFNSSYDNECMKESTECNKTITQVCPMDKTNKRWHQLTTEGPGFGYTSAAFLGVGMIGTTYLALAAKKSVEIDKALRSQKLTDPTLILGPSWLVQGKANSSASAVAPLSFAEDIRCVMGAKTQKKWLK